MDTAHPPINVRVVPDLGDQLLLVINRLEALLGSLAVWEIEDDVGLPAPFADRKALTALQVVGDVVRPTQQRGEAHVVSGRLPRRGCTGSRLPLHFVPIPDAALATLEHAVQVLAVQRPIGRVVAAFLLWLVVFGSKFLVLEVVNVAFGDRVSLGGFFSVTLLILTLLLSRAAVRRLLAQPHQRARGES